MLKNMDTLKSVGNSQLSGRALVMQLGSGSSSHSGLAPHLCPYVTSVSACTSTDPFANLFIDLYQSGFWGYVR